MQRIKDRVDIVEVIGERVRLRRAGRDYVGLCPFHNENTASFHVSPERQSYHCFGCGRGGDVFSFVMETEGIDFRTCLELLAERAGIELQCRSGSSGAKSQDLYQVLKLSARFYSEKLHSSEGARDVDPWQIVCETLRETRNKTRHAEIQERLQRGTAMFEDIAELQMAVI